MFWAQLTEQLERVIVRDGPAGSGPLQCGVLIRNKRIRLERGANPQSSGRSP
jgi:hypothetical protein